MGWETGRSPAGSSSELETDTPSRISPQPQGAWQLEHLFKTYGEDGYIHRGSRTDGQFANFNSWSLDGQPYAGSSTRRSGTKGKCGSSHAHDETDDAGYVVARDGYGGSVPVT